MRGIRLFCSLLYLSSFAYAGAELASGIPSPFTTVSPNFLVGGNGYQITVPSAPTRLEVRVATSNPDAEIDLFVRYEVDVAAGPPVLYDCQVNGSGTVVAIYGRTPFCPGAPLRAGTYYIAIRFSTPGQEVRATIMAAADTGPQNALPARQLASGVPGGFNLGSVDLPRLYNGAYSYAVEVPANATSLTIQLNTDTLNANVDLHVRRGADVTAINVSDHSANTPSGSETITISASSSPPLQPGLYYISLRLISNAVAVTGTVTATLGTPPPPTVTQLTSGQAAPFSFGPVTTPTLVGNFRLNVPPGVARLEFRLVTTTPGVNVDLYYRLGQPVGDPALAGSPKGEGPTGDELITLNATPFQPIQAGDYYVALRILTPNVAVTGTVTAAWSTGQTGQSIDVSPTSLDFGSVPAGQERVLQLTVRNVGGLSLTVSAITSSNPAFTILSPSIPFTLASGVQQAVQVRFLAPSLGSQSGALSISSNDPSRPVVTVPVQGTGATAAGPSLSVAPSIEFGSVNVGLSRDLPLTIRNNGNSTLTVNSITSSNAQFTVVSATTFNVAPNSEVDVTVRFSPTAVGLQSGALTIRSNDANSTATVAVSGVGQTGPTGGPVITLSTTTLSFETQPGANPAPQRFTVRNSGAGALAFRVTSTQTWLTASPTSGTSTGNEVTITVNVNVAGLAAGTHSGELRVTEGTGPAAVPDAPAQAAATVSVRLTIAAGPTQCPPGPSGTPTVPRGSIVNAASFVNAALPNGSVARGSIFSIFGNNLGPTQLVQATRFPLETTLGCVSVRVTGSGRSVDAIPLAAIASQINAIMPSNAPTGDVTITVSFNNRTSAAAAAKVVEASFGAFTVNQNGMGPAIIQNFVSQTEQPINSTQRPARPGQVVTLWGTGLGGVNAADNVAPPVGDLSTPVEIQVGGKTAGKLYSGRAPCCAGLDQIVFTVPADAPVGCFVPVIVRAGGVTGNAVTMAISTDGRPCTDPANPLTPFLTRGGRIGSVQLIRINARLQLDATTNFTNIDADVGSGVFTETRGGEFTYNPITSLPPAGSCSVFSAGNIDLSSLLGGQIPGGVPPETRILNAGPALQVSGPGGNRVLPRSADFGGLYFNLIGGAIPFAGLPSQPLYLNPGDYTVTGPGGPDVGPFTARLRVPASLNWTNRDQLAQVTRAGGVTLNWSGGDPASQGITILGGNLDNQSGAGAAFVCFADIGAGAFHVPASILSTLPPSNLQQPNQSVGFLAIGAGQARDIPAFSATGLDAGYALFGQFGVLSVVFR
jgi:uncharacterized protein (TIGR03437 family)